MLGQTVEENLFPFEDPVGQIDPDPEHAVPRDRRPLEEGRGQWAADQDDVILAPSTTVLYRLAGGQRINMIHGERGLARTIAGRAGRAHARSCARRTACGDGEDDDFRIRSQAEIIETAT